MLHATLLYLVMHVTNNAIMLKLLSGYFEYPFTYVFFRCTVLLRDP